MNNWKINIRYYSFILMLLFSFQLLGGKSTHENSKTIEKVYPATANTVLDLKHKHGPLTVEQYQGRDVQVVLFIEVSGDDANELEELLKEIDLDEHISNNLIDVSTKMNVINWNTNNKRAKISFKSGLTVREVEELKISMTVKVPVIKQLRVQNKYDEILLSDLSSGVSIDLYSGSLHCGDIKGNLELKSKYSKLALGNFDNGIFDLYDAKATFKNGGSLNITSKYSEIEIGDISSLELDAYDDEYEIGNINGSVSIKDKYSEIELGSAASVALDIYDGKITMEASKDLVMKSKYSEYQFGKCQKVTLDSYDDDFNFTSLFSLEIREMKYSTIKAERIEKALIAESYDSEIYVEAVGDQFEMLNLDCKYDKVKIPVAQLAGFEINAESKYGKLDLNLDGLQNLRHIKDGSTLNISGKRPGSSKIAKVTITAYDSDIKL